MMTRTLSKVRTRVVTATFRLLFRPDVRIHMARLGTDYGGWWVPSSLLNSQSVCFCAGVGTDISFDLALLEHFNCTVYGIDPTPQSLAWIRGIDNLDTRFQMVSVGLGGSPGDAKFYVPADAAHVSHSIKNIQKTENFFVARLDTVAGLMSQLGHKTIDLLKLDIEGAEHDAIGQMLADGVTPNVVCVEYDQPEPLAWARQTTKKLRNAGYLLAKVDGLNLTFVLDHAVDKISQPTATT